MSDRREGHVITAVTITIIVTIIIIITTINAIIPIISAVQIIHIIDVTDIGRQQRVRWRFLPKHRRRQGAHTTSKHGRDGAVIIVIILVISNIATVVVVVVVVIIVIHTHTTHIIVTVATITTLRVMGREMGGMRRMGAKNGAERGAIRVPFRGHNNGGQGRLIAAAGRCVGVDST